MARSSSQKSKDYVVTVVNEKTAEEINVTAKGRRMAENKALVQAGLGFKVKHCDTAKEHGYQKKSHERSRLW